MTTQRKPTVTYTPGSNIRRVVWPERPADVRVFVTGKPTPDNHNRITAGAISAKQGRVHFQTPAALAWRGAVMVAIRNALVARHVTLTPPVSVSCVFCNVTGDPPNYCKTTFDAIQDATGINDKHYRPAQIDGQRHQGQPKGVLIELWGSGPHGAA